MIPYSTKKILKMEKIPETFFYPLSFSFFLFICFPYLRKGVQLNHKMYFQLHSTKFILLKKITSRIFSLKSQEKNDRAWVTCLCAQIAFFKQNKICQAYNIPRKCCAVLTIDDIILRYFGCVREKAMLVIFLHISRFSNVNKFIQRLFCATTK